MDHGMFQSVKQVFAKKPIWLVCSLVLLSLLTCRPIFPAPAPTPTPWQIPRLDDLQFDDPETGRRFRALDRCIGNIVDETWQTTSYQPLGNFYESSWCRGTGTGSNCRITSAEYDLDRQHDQHAITLYTLSYNYDTDSPEVFGLGFDALWVPKTTGWEASFSFSEKGKSVVGEGWGVNFSEYTTSTGSPEEIVSLPSYYVIYSPNPTTFEYSSDLPMREDLALYLSSPEAMRDRGLAEIQALANKVAAAINAHQVNTCDQGPYLGGGLPPVCPTRSMTPGEEAAELARAEEYFSNQGQLLHDYYQEMYAAWMMAFPLDQCWP